MSRTPRSPSPRRVAARAPRWLLACATTVACAATPPPAPPPVAPQPPAPTGSQTSKLRQALRVAPLEMVFSGVRGQPGADEALSVRNVTGDAVQIRELRIVGEDAASFALQDVPTLPRYLAPDKTIEARVAFLPAADARPGLHRATLIVQLGDEEETGPPIDLSALVLTGAPGEEPSLAEIAAVLGYGVDVGGGQRTLTGAGLLGDQLEAGRFRPIKAGNLALDPVARFSSLGGPLAYGIYRAGADGSPRREQLGVLSPDETQHLNPGFHEGQGTVSFDPGSREPFGVYVALGDRVTYSENARNQAVAATPPPRRPARRGKPAPAGEPGSLARPVRVYPLKSRDGTPVANAYLIAFEEAVDADFQDAVFVLWNVAAEPASNE